MQLNFTAGKFMNYASPEKRSGGELLYFVSVIEVKDGNEKNGNSIEGFSIHHLADGITYRLDKMKARYWEIKNLSDGDNLKAEPLTDEEYAELRGLLPYDA